ncbi:hypothetical protein [Pseudonocardia sp. DLS-67]
MQNPPPTRPADGHVPASSPPRDLPAGGETHLTPAIGARVDDREPDPAAQPRTHAHADTRTLDDRLTATRTLTATGPATHAASAVRIPAAPDHETIETGAPHPQADEHSAGALNNLHPLPDDREPGR